MEKYSITITEISKGTIEVEADDYEQALEIAENEYFNHPDYYVLEPYGTIFEWYVTRSQ